MYSKGRVLPALFSLYVILQFIGIYVKTHHDDKSLNEQAAGMSKRCVVSHAHRVSFCGNKKTPYVSRDFSDL